MTNFCRFPPESDRATFSGPGVRTSKSEIIRSVNTRVLAQFRSPRDASPSRAAPVNSAFSMSDIFGAAAWPSRSSGAASRPSVRRASGPVPDRSRPLNFTMPRALGSSPDRTPSNSSWPLPATPPIPRTSPDCTENEISFSVIPKAEGEVTDKPVTANASWPRLGAARFGTARIAPTIISAMSRADVSRGTQSPTTLPPRRMVAASHNVRISSSL